MSENKTNPPTAADDDKEAVIRRAMAKIAEMRNAPLASKKLQDRMLSELGIENDKTAAQEPAPRKGG